jgi:hypothetical protein
MPASAPTAEAPFAATLALTRLTLPTEPLPLPITPNNPTALVPDALIVRFAIVVPLPLLSPPLKVPVNGLARVPIGTKPAPPFQFTVPLASILFANT